MLHGKKVSYGRMTITIGKNKSWYGYETYDPYDDTIIDHEEGLKSEEIALSVAKNYATAYMNTHIRRNNE